jgi:uncharacterized protein
MQIERPWGITAFGAASVSQRPDLVRARFNVARVKEQPESALQVVTELVAAVRRVLRERGIPDAAVHRSRLDLATAWDKSYGADRKQVGYRCAASFAVESTDLDGVQQLLVDLVAAGANEIEGVDFDVVGKPELRAAARRKAVTAARRKAALYAEAAEVRLGDVVHVEDVDPERFGAERYRSHGDAVGATSDADLAPGHVVISAAVILGFAIAHG